MNYITAKKLKEMLNSVNDDDIIILSKDSEGNGFSPLSEDYGKDNYLPEESWCGQIYLRELNDELYEAGYSEEDLGNQEDGDKMIKCVTLYPLN